MPPAHRTSRTPQPRSRRPTGARDEESPARLGGRAGDDTVHLHDPRAIRALAHPARMAIVDALAAGDELTATECAALTGLSPSATAYHLKFLQRHGFAEPATARSDGRERPWRASDRRREFDLDTSTAAGSAAAAVVTAAYFERSQVVAEEFMATVHEEPREWQDVASLTGTDLWLTVEETRSVTVALAEALEQYRDRNPGNRPDGSRRVRIMSVVVPHRHEQR